jgi:hypothetical protein
MGSGPSCVHGPNGSLIVHQMVRLEKVCGASIGETPSGAVAFPATARSWANRALMRCDLPESAMCAIARGSEQSL